MYDKPEKAIAAIAKLIEDFYNGGEHDPQATVDAISTVANGTLGTAASMKSWMRTFGTSMETIKRAAILGALETTNGNNNKAAKLLEISVRQIQYRRKEWGLRPADLAPPAEEQVRQAG